MIAKSECLGMQYIRILLSLHNDCLKHKISCYNHQDTEKDTNIHPKDNHNSYQLHQLSAMYSDIILETFDSFEAKQSSLLHGKQNMPAQKQQRSRSCLLQALSHGEAASKRSQLSGSSRHPERLVGRHGTATIGVAG